MKQKEINKMIELIKYNPDWLKGDTKNCNFPSNLSDAHPCKGCPICSKRKPEHRIYTKGTIHCGDSFLVKFKRIKEEDRFEILTACL